MTLEQLGYLSPIVIIAAAFVFMGLERLFSYNAGQSIFREGFWVDLLCYGIGQSYLLGLIISKTIFWLDSSVGSSRIRFVSHWGLGTQLLFFLVTHDFVTYLIHRSQHRFPFLWATHEAHHSCPRVDWLSGIRSSSYEIFLYEFAKFIPIILLGADPRIPLLRGMVDSTYGMFIHSNLKVRLGPLLWIFNGPQLHRWHHALGVREAYDKNFATKFALWDHLFGTTFDPTDRKANRYGSDDLFYPSGYFAQHALVLKRWLDLYGKNLSLKLFTRGL